jgi:hypothetical protein
LDLTPSKEGFSQSEEEAQEEEEEEENKIHVSSLLHCQERRDGRVVIKTKPSVVKCMHGQKMKKTMAPLPQKKRALLEFLLLHQLLQTTTSTTATKTQNPNNSGTHVPPQ